MSKKHSSDWIARLEYILFRCFETLIKAIPLKVCYCISGCLAWIGYHLLGTHRQRAISHVLYSGFCKTEAEAKALVKKNFIHCAKVLIEVIKAPQIINKENFRKYIKLELLDNEAKRFFNEPNSEKAIIITGHLGNWELAGPAYQYLSGLELVSIMRDLDNKYLGEYVYRHRGHKTVSKQFGILPIFRALLRGSSIAIVADQHAAGSEGTQITFCGKPAKAHKTPGYLAIKTKCPILCGALFRLDDDFHFKLTVTSPIHYESSGDMETDVQRIAQLYSDKLEQLLRMYPEQWNWAHRRWLYCNRRQHENTAEEASDIDTKKP